MVEDISQGKSRNMQTVQYKDVGTILNVRPTVSADRKSVQLDILVENSSVVGTDADQAPVIKTIRTRNKVTLRSGQTTAIGGLMLQREDSDGNYVPILYRLPIIGGILFGSKYKSHQKSQLIIFITPTVA
jgi:type II secretory pathway component GspD/PulD (secretin)